MKLYYVLEMREDYESMSALYITSNLEKAISWHHRNSDESLRYVIASKEQEWEDVFLKCDLDNDPKYNYFAGLYEKIQDMGEDEFKKYWDWYISDPKNIKMFEL